MTTVAVAGAAGLTGTAITSGLVRAGYSVIAVVRRPVESDATSVVVGDCTDAQVMAPVLPRVDVLIHVAGIARGAALARLPGIGDIPRVVAISSAGIYSRHRASAIEYRAGENALTAANKRTMLVRPTMIYGSDRDRNIHHLIAFAHRYGFLPLVSDGSARLQPIHFDDLASAVVALVARTETGAVDAGGAQPVTLRQLMRAVFVALRQQPRLFRVPVGPARLAASVLDRVRGGRWAERVDRLVEDRTVDATVLTRMTGIHPRTFDVGVRDQVEAMRHSGALR